jgi:hypothetical protein
MGNKDKWERNDRIELLNSLFNCMFDGGDIELIMDMETSGIGAIERHPDEERILIKMHNGKQFTVDIKRWYPITSEEERL